MIYLRHEREVLWCGLPADCLYDQLKYLASCRLFVRPVQILGNNWYTLGVRRKYCDEDCLQTVCTTSSNTFLSFTGSIPYNTEFKWHLCVLDLMAWFGLFLILKAFYHHYKKLYKIVNNSTLGREWASVHIAMYRKSFQHSLLYEPRHEKTCLRGLRPGKTQTGLCSQRS